MTRREWCKRYLFFLAGLFINSFGVSFITKAALGTSPISSVPYTLSLGFSPTLGMFTLYMSIVLILIQMILLRKDFPRQYLLQIPVSFLFSWFIDMTMELLGFLSPAAYPAKVICLLLGCAILGFGVFMEMAAGVVMLPGECFVNAISRNQGGFRYLNHRCRRHHWHRPLQGTGRSEGRDHCGRCPCGDDRPPSKLYHRAKSQSPAGAVTRPVSPIYPGCHKTERRQASAPS